MSKQSEKVKKWRKTCKTRIIKAMGGKCCICAYDRCSASLALHHLDPSKKDFGFGAIRANCKNWSALVVELRKCVLICNNCHGEVHANMTTIPNNAPKFNEDFADYKTFERELIENLNPCPVCKGPKSIHLINCSPECAHKAKRKINWDAIDLIEELKTKSIVALADELNCSDMAVRKRLKKLRSNINSNN